MNINIQHAIDAARGTQTGAIVEAAFGVARDVTPRYATTASLSSDGFVFAGFVDKHGENHLGAFVCDYSDFKRNAEALADHVGLTGADRAEYAAKINGWIADKWSDVPPVK